MTTTPTLTVTARTIIDSAYRAAGIVPTRQAVKNYEFDRGIESLNFLIKAWQNQEIHLWSEEEAIIPLVKGQRKYVLGPGGDEVAVSTSFNATNIETTAAVATDTVLNVFSTEDMTAAPNILSGSPTISVQDWTAINSATIASDGTTLTVTNGAAVAGGAEYTLEVEEGERYILSYTYVQGTSPGMTVSAVSGTTLDTETLVASGAGELDFTANSDTVTLRVENTSAVSGETSLISAINYVKVSSGDRVGVELDDGTREWSYLISIPTSTTIRISTPLSDAAAINNLIFNYSEKIDRPLRVLQCRYASGVQASEIPTNKWSRDEYFDQPDKDSEGQVSNWYYSPQLTNGDLYVWQTASSVDNVLRMTYIRPLEISQDTLDTQDIPAEWVNALKWSLASELGAEFNIPDAKQQKIDGKAGAHLKAALDHDVEDSHIQLEPNWS